MAHKTLIDGTAYEIKGGTALIDGTAYSIKNGKTLVGGTAYEVGFSSSVIVNVIQPSGSTGRVTIDGNVYTESGTYEALESITVSVQGIFAPSSYFMATAYVYLNGVKVAETPANPPLLDYSLSLDGCSEITIEYKYGSSVYNCYITTV